MSLKTTLNEAVRLLGFKLGNKSPKEEFPTYSIPQQLDGASTISTGGIYGTFVDLDGTAKTMAELITRYRDMSLQPECDEAVTNIINDAVVQQDNETALKINLSNVNQNESVKEEITQEFQNVLKLLRFSEEGDNIFKMWYIDGRLYYNIVIDPENTREGIQELKYLDPRRIHPIRQIEKRIGSNGQEIVDSILEYYVYNERQVASISNTSATGIKIAKDAICYVHSGEVDTIRNLVLGKLHKAIKPLNQLRAVEDSMVIYRLSRAAERRVFYIDVGSMPTGRAEQYVKSVMSDFRNKLVYDSASGAVRDDKKFLSMQEDFFLPRREGGKGTEITTLPGGQNLGQMEDVLYFQQRLYKSLGVPISRLKGEDSMGFGKSAEISRDEYNFSRFIDKLRKRFEHLFFALLKVQLILKGVITLDDWEIFREQISFEWQSDSYFKEANENEIFSGKLAILQQADAFEGKYFSREYVMTNILKFTEDEIELMKKQIESEVVLRDMDDRRAAGYDSQGVPFDPQMALELDQSEDVHQMEMDQSEEQHQIKLETMKAKQKQSLSSSSNNTKKKSTPSTPTNKKKTGSTKK